LNERRRELAILRSVGARPCDIFLLLTYEGFFVTLIGILLGVVLLAALTTGFAPMLQEKLGIAVRFMLVSQGELQLLGMVFAVGLLASVAPGYQAYRLSLADGMTPRL